MVQMLQGAKGGGNGMPQSPPFTAAQGLTASCFLTGMKLAAGFILLQTTKLGWVT